MSIRFQGLCVTMHAPKQIVDAKIGDDNGEEGKDHIEVVNKRFVEHGDGGAVERHGIDHKRDKRPSLLWVP